MPAAKGLGAGRSVGLHDVPGGAARGALVTTNSKMSRVSRRDVTRLEAKLPKKKGIL